MKLTEKFVLVCIILVLFGFGAYRFWSAKMCPYVERPLVNHPTLVVVNVLEKKLYDDCHIKGSVHADIADLEPFERTIQKNDQIIVYCSNYLCSTSDYVAKKLKETGYKNVAVYAGGMAEWYQHGLPIEGPAKASYLTKKIEVPSQTNTDKQVVTMQELATIMGVSAKK